MIPNYVKKIQKGSDQPLKWYGPPERQKRIWGIKRVTSVDTGTK